MGHATLQWLTNAIWAVLIWQKLEGRLTCSWWAVFAPTIVNHLLHIPMQLVVLWLANYMVYKQIGPPPPPSATPGLVLQYAILHHVRVRSHRVDHANNAIESMAMFLVKLLFCNALHQGNLSDTPLRLLFTPIWACWVVTFVLLCLKDRTERMFGSSRDLFFIFLLFVAFKVDDQSSYSWRVVFLVPWMWFSGLLVVAAMVFLLLLFAKVWARPRDLLLPIGFMLLLVSTVPQFVSYIALVRRLDGDTGTSIARIMWPNALSWLLMWGSAGVIAAALRHKEAVRDALLARGAVWTAHERVARRLHEAERDEAQRRVDELTEEEVARLVESMMAGKSKPGRLRRVGENLYKRIASLEPALAEQAAAQAAAAVAASVAGSAAGSAPASPTGSTAAGAGAAGTPAAAAAAGGAGLGLFRQTNRVVPLGALPVLGAQQAGPAAAAAATATPGSPSGREGGGGAAAGHGAAGPAASQGAAAAAAAADSPRGPLAVSSPRGSSAAQILVPPPPSRMRSSRSGGGGGGNVSGSSSWLGRMAGVAAGVGTVPAAAMTAAAAGDAGAGGGGGGGGPRGSSLELAPLEEGRDVESGAVPLRNRSRALPPGSGTALAAVPETSSPPGRPTSARQTLPTSPVPPQSQSQSQSQIEGPFSRRPSEANSPSGAGAVGTAAGAAAGQRRGRPSPVPSRHRSPSVPTVGEPAGSAELPAAAAAVSAAPAAAAAGGGGASGSGAAAAASDVAAAASDVGAAAAAGASNPRQSSSLTEEAGPGSPREQTTGSSSGGGGGGAGGQAGQSPFDAPSAAAAATAAASSTSLGSGASGTGSSGAEGQGRKAVAAAAAAAAALPPLTSSSSSFPRRSPAVLPDVETDPEDAQAAAAAAAAEAEAAAAAGQAGPSSTASIAGSAAAASDAGAAAPPAPPAAGVGPDASAAPAEVVEREDVANICPASPDSHTPRAEGSSETCDGSAGPAGSAAAAAAATAPSSGDDLDSDNACVICYDGEATCVFLECGHGGFCRRCAFLMFVRPPNECPSCRTVIDQVVEIEPVAAVGQVAKVK